MNDQSKKAVDFAGFPEAGIEETSRQEEKTRPTEQGVPKASSQTKSKSTPVQQPKPPPPLPSGSYRGVLDNGWLWVFGAFVLFLVWAGIQHDAPERTTSSSSTTYTPPSTSRTQSPPSVPTLSTPPVATNNVHSPGEIRYCLATDIRIEALRPYMDSDNEINVFNNMIADYNSRCSSYRYRPGTLERARRDVERYRSVIVANAWDGLSLETSPPPERKTAAQHSHLITKIQKGLSTLGYNVGVADGIYGDRTKSAIKAFQRSSGLEIDGRASDFLLEQITQAGEVWRDYGAQPDTRPQANPNSKASSTRSSRRSLALADLLESIQAALPIKDGNFVYRNVWSDSSGVAWRVDVKDTDKVRFKDSDWRSALVSRVTNWICTEPVLRDVLKQDFTHTLTYYVDRRDWEMRLKYNESDCN